MYLRQREWCLKYGIAIGVLVVIGDRAHDLEDSWDGVWQAEMDDLVGEACRVIAILEDDDTLAVGMRLRLPGR